MKKRVIILMLLTILSTTLFGCTQKSKENVESVDKVEELSTENEENTEEVHTGQEIRVFNVDAMKGPTGMGIAKLIEDSNDLESSKFRTVYRIVGSADEIVANMGNSDLEFATVPANLASVLYNNTKGKVKVLAINTLGVLYIVEKGEVINSIEDLKGLTITAPGKGTTPEFALRNVLMKNGIDPDSDVTLDFKSEASEAAQSFLQGQADVVMLPEPFLTTVLSKNPEARIALDINDEWKNVSDGNSMVTGVLIAKGDIMEEDLEYIDAFLDEYKKSIDFANENVEEAAKLVDKYEIAPEVVALKAIPNSSLYFAEGSEMKDLLSNYLETLYEFEPKAVGGNLPDDNFYFER